MSIPYVIILSDSEDEDEPMINADIPANSDDESHDSNAMEEDSSEEEDPSEDEAIPETPPQSPETPPQSSENSPISPVHSTYDISGPRTVRVPAKSMARSNQRMNTSYHTTTPSTDPYLADRVWNYLPTTLHEWRKEEKIPSITEVGESSTARHNFPYTHEPPHHTVPLLVTRAIRHEDRLNHIEDALIEMPGEMVLENVQYQIGCLDTNIESVRAETEELKQRATNRDIIHTGMESMILHRMDQMNTRLTQMDAMVNTLRDLITSIMKGDHLPKK